MEKIINFGIPHVGEQIFNDLSTNDLIQCLEVSHMWKTFAETTLLQRSKGKMYESCESGTTKLVKLLLENYNGEESGLNVKDEWGRTSFMIACKYGHKDVVKLLIDYAKGTIDLNARSNRGWTALMYACSGGHKDIVKLLIDYSERPIDLNASNILEVTAFMFACNYGHKDVVKMLLDHSKGKIEFNARDDNGWTAFIRACIQGHNDVVQLLLEQSGGKIDFNAKDNSGKTAFLRACQVGHTGVVQLIIKHARTISIEIPTNQSISELIENWNDSKRFKEMATLIDKFHHSLFTTKSIFPITTKLH